MESKCRRNFELGAPSATHNAYVTAAVVANAAQGMEAKAARVNLKMDVTVLDHLELQCPCQLDSGARHCPFQRDSEGSTHPNQTMDTNCFVYRSLAASLYT